MKEPIPLNAATVDNAPLNGESLLFPCQGGEGGTYEGETNIFEAGSQQTLRFSGSAVHGGGSCQISVTYENPPPADKSKWKVIHSFIGGCPSTAVGNLPTTGQGPNGLPDGVECAPGETGECKSILEFPVPADLPNGEAFVAWTWLSNTGVREFYMTCAAAEITGGSDDTAFFDGLPEVFVANIPGECTTAPGNLEFPNPGESVTRIRDSDPSAIGDCPSTGSGGSGGGSTTPPSNDDSSDAGSGSGSGSDGSNDSSEDSTGPDRGGSFIPIEDSDDTEAAPISPPADSPPKGNEPVNDAPVSSPSAGSGQCAEGFIACSEPGQMVCEGTSSFGICNIDGCAKVMPLAAGAVCENGAVGQKVKRSLRGSSSANHGRLHYQHRRRLADASF